MVKRLLLSSSVEAAMVPDVSSSCHLPCSRSLSLSPPPPPVYYSNFIHLALSLSICCFFFLLVRSVQHPLARLHTGALLTCPPAFFFSSTCHCCPALHTQRVCVALLEDCARQRNNTNDSTGPNKMNH